MQQVELDTGPVWITNDRKVFEKGGDAAAHEAVVANEIKVEHFVAEVYGNAGRGQDTRARRIVQEYLEWEAAQTMRVSGVPYEVPAEDVAA